MYSVLRNILNIASSSGICPANSAYCVSIWGIRGLTEGYARSLAPLGIVLNPEMNDKIAGFKEIHEGIITDPNSKINVMVLPTDEEIMIVKDTFNVAINK